MELNTSRTVRSKAAKRELTRPAHPHHVSSQKRLNRVKGQLDAVSRMIDERRYCPEIIQQVRAATNALKAVEREILKGHLEGCVRSSMNAKDPFEMQKKVDEILKLWN